MNYFITLLTVTILAFTAPAYAGHTADKHAPALAKVRNNVHVSVNGLVCDFCARALEKVFGKEEAVNNIDVNLDTKIITITFNDGKNLDDARLTDLITDAGYHVESIHRGE